MAEKITTKEMACRCCGEIKVDMQFLAQLRRAREISGVPYIINSGYRCPKHNKAVGSTSQNHVMGRAADIKATDGPTRGRILKGLYKAGFVRVGIRKDFIHVDNMPLAESCWLY